MTPESQRNLPETCIALDWSLTEHRSHGKGEAPTQPSAAEQALRPFICSGSRETSDHVRWKSYLELSGIL